MTSQQLPLDLHFIMKILFFNHPFSYGICCSCTIIPFGIIRFSPHLGATAAIVYLSQEYSTLWRQLLDPRFSMVSRFGDRAYYRQIGPGWRVSRPYFSGVSSVASGRFCNPLSMQSFASTHSALRSFSAWSLSFVELDLFVTLPSEESGTLA
jgi:hypothetical protein